VGWDSEIREEEARETETRETEARESSEKLVSWQRREIQIIIIDSLVYDIPLFVIG
jgi:hypothetical protein